MCAGEVLVDAEVPSDWGHRRCRLKQGCPAVDAIPVGGALGRAVRHRVLAEMPSQVYSFASATDSVESRNASVARSDSTIYMAYYTVAHLLHGEAVKASVLRGLFARLSKMLHVVRETWMVGRGVPPKLRTATATSCQERKRHKLPGRGPHR